MVEQMHLVLTRGGDDRLVPSTLDVNLCDQQPCAYRVGLGEPRADGVHDLAASAELCGPLASNAVCDKQVDAVLVRACSRQELGICGGGDRPVGRQSDDLRAPERKRSRHLRKAQVVADLHADPAERSVEHGELVPGQDVAIDAEERQVRLPVPTDDPVRVRPGRRCCEACFRRARASPRRNGSRAGRTPHSRAVVKGPGSSSACGQSLLGALEHVAGARALG